MLLDDLKDEDGLERQQFEKLDLVEFILLAAVFFIVFLLGYNAIQTPVNTDILSTLSIGLLTVPPLICVSKFRKYRKGKEVKWLLAWATFSCLGAVLLGATLLFLMLYLFKERVWTIETLVIILVFLVCIAFASYAGYILKALKKDDI